MSGRVSYLGGIVKDGLVLDLDAGKLDSYNRVGTTWNDVSGNGNNGTLTNFSSPSPQTIWNSNNGGSIIFDGTNDYVTNIGNTSTFSFIQNTNIYTISVWVNPNQVKEMYIMGNNNGATNYKGLFFGYVPATNGVIFYITNETIATLNHSINNFFTLNTWVNIICVGNGVNNKIYKNGLLINSSNFLGISSGNSSFSLSLGRINNNNQWYWNGGISQCLIYNKELSSQEVLQNYNATKQRYI